MDVSEDGLREHCSALASSYKIPDRIETCAQLPSTPTGKLLRRDLRRMAEELVAHAAIDNAGR
jgi:acyl-CoA synthetase (AMP-forming)/AMP-acid ligase II